MIPEDRFDAVVGELVTTPDVTPPGSGSAFGSHALRFQNKSFRDVGAGEQEPVGVFGELARQPLGAGLCADENEQAPDRQCRRLLPAGIQQLHAS